jgi:hypothetical protein
MVTVTRDADVAALAPRRGCSPGEDATMSAPKGHHGNRPHPAGADAQSLVLPREQAGIAAQTAHTVHLAPLPQLSGMPRRVVLPVPDPHPHPDPGWPSVEHPRAPLRSWRPVGSTPPSGGTECGAAAVARYPGEQRGTPPGARRGHHATTRGHTPVRREHLGPAEGLTRMTCLARITPTNADHRSQSTGQCPLPSPAGPSVEHAVPRRASSRRPAGHHH